MSPLGPACVPRQIKLIDKDIDRPNRIVNLGHGWRAIGGEFVSWGQPLFDPIILPGERKLVTLRDAALYVTKLPKAEHDTHE